MKKKLFGEHLVDRGLVAPEQLLSALIEQVEVTPSLPVLLYKEKLLSHRDLLRALSAHARSEKSFEGVCKELGLWTPSVSAGVEKARTRDRVRVGELLLSKGFLTPETLIKELENFLSNPPAAEKEDTGPVTLERFRQLQIMRGLACFEGRAAEAREYNDRAQALLGSLRKAAQRDVA